MIRETLGSPGVLERVGRGARKLVLAQSQGWRLTTKLVESGPTQCKITPQGRAAQAATKISRLSGREAWLQWLAEFSTDLG